MKQFFRTTLRLVLGIIILGYTFLIVYAYLPVEEIPSRTLATKEDLLERMEYGIIDYSILFPSELLPIGYLPDPKWAAALASAYNEYMVDAYSNVAGVKIAIVVSPKSVEHAVSEIEKHASNSDVVTVSIPDVGVNPPL